MIILIISSVLLWIISFLNLVLILAIIKRINNEGSTPVPVLPYESEVPNFRATSLEGEEITRDVIHGKESVLVFLTTTCGHCRKLLPGLINIALRSMNTNKLFYMVFDTDLEETEEFVLIQHIKAPCLCAPKGTNSMYKNFLIDSVPSYVAIDKMGKVKGSGPVGFDDWKKFEKILWKEGIGK